MPLRGSCCFHPHPLSITPPRLFLLAVFPNPFHRSWLAERRRFPVPFGGFLLVGRDADSVLDALREEAHRAAVALFRAFLEECDGPGLVLRDTGAVEIMHAEIR